ncbi:alpha-protein kinase 1 isoform X1 [Pimephales promelas]|uniref:alpha-protein kinase 1 isoform X1 n=1 Tax=Pimephales promelas TaxID=90988 RepID=UPI0019557728|nr:alpha-protein kinase 1 isoform X1 [Pimephales promelas]XP_039524844.1 alpha-protein kinase 1 isoform X1 [Pimephales promelas]XP_039524845.1 alpha-protein kinase 1 isoform X1 [Pimephales promelas]KAG1928115.1 eukaryotic elongation factor 2 kinase [Pimephales promelas]
MSGQEVSLLLQECLRRAVTGPQGDTDTVTLPHPRGLFPDDLHTLLQEAADRKWPFVEEKWQYKQSVTSEDKMNSSDLVRKHLPQLLVFLRDRITSGEPRLAVAVVFLLDRLLYWMDGSHVLLKIAKALHKRYPDVPIAPQVIIRQARVYLNTGKLQKAEFILSSLISSNASTGCWPYQKASDRTLVQAVSLQVRGQVLQTLGLWLEAAELIWASLIGFYTLPQPDKKGIGTSLGLLADTLTSMNDRDFTALQEKPHIDLSFLGESRHRLLCAARAAKMAVVFSQYGPLYVLTNVVAQGICLLSYSFSKKCPMEDHQTYLALAKEAFEIGLLTKTAGDAVTSKLELHTFLKAAYCLAATHRWISGESETVLAATSVCREALALFVEYCARADSSLCAEIMARIQQIKSLLKVEPFCNSDARSFIPDSYRSMEFGTVLFTLSDFAKALDVFGKHHKSVCEAFEKGVRGDPCSTHSQCITAFQTDTEVLPTADHSNPLSSKQNPSSSGSLVIVDQGCGERSSFGSFEALDGGKEANVVSPSIPDNFRHNKGSQNQSTPKLVPVITEGVEENIPNTSGTQRRGLRKNLEARTSSSSSWEHVSGSSQSGIETTDDDVEQSRFGSYKGLDGSREANAVSPSVPNNFRHNKGSQSQSQPNIEPITTEDVEDIAPNTSGTQRRDLTKNLEARTSSSSFSSGSSWEHGSGQSQSGVETTDDDVEQSRFGSYKGRDGSREANAVSPSVPNNFRHNKGSQSQSQPNIEPITTEDVEENLTNTSGAQRRDAWKNMDARTSSSSFGSGSSWERVSGQSQSGVETVEDLDDPSHDGNEINKGAKFGGSTSSFSLCDSFGSHSSWQKLSVSPVANVERLELTDKKKAFPQQIPEDPGTTTESDPFEELGFEHLSGDDEPLCSGCFRNCIMGSGVLTGRDYRALLGGVCESCLVKRLPNTPLKPLDRTQLEKPYDAIVLKYSKASGLWMGCETSVYIGKPMGVKGKQRQAIELQYLHQEQLLSSYVGKEYLKNKGLHAHLDDVERQMTAQYYVTEFNKRLYDNNVTAQIFFIPSEVLLVLESHRILTCLSAEPFMSGTFVKLTNNARGKAESDATQYGIAFGHFTYEFSRHQEVVVDLQGWITASGKGLTYLTDPQIHSLRKPRSSNFQQTGITNFIKHQHGDDCNEICRAARLTHITQHTPHSHALQLYSVS